MIEATLGSFKSVLRHLGWDRESSGRIGELWADDEGHRVGIPNDMSPHHREWEYALEQIASYTSQDLASLRERIDWYGYDVSRFRVDGPSLAQTVSVDAGYNLFKTARQAIRASATTSRQKKPVINGNFSSAGDQILARSRFGQTQEGSYLVPLLVPIGEPETGGDEQPTITGSNVILEQAEIEPEERRVTRTLSDSLQAISTRLIEPARQPRKQVVEDLVQVGVSRELLKTLTDVVKPPGLREFSVSFQWSESIDLEPPAGKPSVVIPSEASEILSQASDLIAKVEEPKTETFSGPIIELRDDPDKKLVI